MSKPKHCMGCGVALQTEHKDQTGFIPEKAFERDPVVCHRCFRMKHYNEASTVALDDNEFLKILNHVSETDSLVLNIVDLFDFEGSLITGIARFAGSNPIVLVVNKVDLLPKAVNHNRIINWIKKQASEYGLKPVEIILCSAKKNIGFERVIEALNKHRHGRDVYVVGATNVGKSTLINRLIRDFSELDDLLTTSRYPGTTLDLIEIPLEDGKHMIDTPGIVYRSRLTELISAQDLQAIMPEREIKPVVFQLNEQQTLWFGALARFDFVAGARQSFTCYMSNAIHIHRTKLENANDLYDKHKGVMLVPPPIERLDDLPPLAKHRFHIAQGGEQEISISGLGWIKMNSDAGATIDVHAPSGVKVVLRNALI